MGKQVINNIKCAKCHRDFDVATEDLEWEHAHEIEAGDSPSGFPETGIMQEIKCPHCSKANTIIYRGIHNIENATHSHEVYSI